MENYLQKLLINQQNENILRDERDQMIKRHERELEEIDERMAQLIRQRNQIIDDIQNFSKNTSNILLNNDNHNNVHDKDSGRKHNKCKFIKSTDSAFSKPIRLDSNNNPINEDNDLSNNKTPSPPIKQTRTLKLFTTPRIPTSSSTSNIILTKIPESPTTVQIESMLNKVRNNVAIDPSTLNECIDLLSTTNKNNQKKENNNDCQCETAKEKDKVDPLAKVTESKQPSSPKRRFETPEERRKRIEKVLFETPGNKMQKGSMSKSFSSLSTIDFLGNNNHHRSQNQLQIGKQSQQQRSSNLSLNRYSNRTKVRRNHSLSPLRFGSKKTKNTNNGGDEQSEPTSPTTSITTAENSPKEIRKFKSEQQLFFDENLSMASFDDDGGGSSQTTTSQNNDNLSLEMDPDKLSLQQIDDDNVGDNGEEEPEDHLLAPSKVAKSQDAFKQIFFPVDVREKPLMSKEELNKIKNKKTMVKSKSIGWAEQAERNSNCNDQALSLNVDYLSHLRHSSASPVEQKLREKELNNLNNTKKFRCYQDFWENKTKEILTDKKDRSEIKQQPRLMDASKTQTNWSLSALQPKISKVATKIPELKRCTKINENINKSIQQPAMANIMIDGKENRATYRPQFIRIIDTKKHATQTLTQHTNNNTNSNKSTTKTQDKLSIPNDESQKSPSPNNYSDSDSEKLIEKLRYFKQDIQRQKMKHQMKQQQQLDNITNPIPAKSLDLHYMNKQQQQPSIDCLDQPKSTNNQRNNRIKLTRSYSRQDSIQTNDSDDKASPPIITPTKQSKINNWPQHPTNSLSFGHHPNQLSAEIRSTYF